MKRCFRLLLLVLMGLFLLQGIVFARINGSRYRSLPIELDRTGDIYRKTIEVPNAEQLYLFYRIPDSEKYVTIAIYGVDSE